MNNTSFACLLSSALLLVGTGCAGRPDESLAGRSGNIYRSGVPLERRIAESHGRRDVVDLHRQGDAYHYDLNGRRWTLTHSPWRYFNEQDPKYRQASTRGPNQVRETDDLAVIRRSRSWQW